MKIQEKNLDASRNSRWKQPRRFLYKSWYKDLYWAWSSKKRNIIGSPIFRFHILTSPFKTAFAWIQGLFFTIAFCLTGITAWNTFVELKRSGDEHRNFCKNVKNINVFQRSNDSSEHETRENTHAACRFSQLFV